VQPVVFLLLGLANGAVFASLAIALVVTYRSSGVINFATGAVALFGAYEYAFLRQGHLFNPIPGPPVTFRVGGSWPLLPALLAAVALCALLGLLLYAVIFRPLRTAPPVARAVASIGVLIVITELIAKRLGTAAVTVTAIFPSRTYHIGKVHISADRIWFAVTIVAVALVISTGFRFTRFGLHTRAAAESEKGALVSGVSPERVATINWMISCGVAGLAGILIAPIVPLVPSAYTLFIIPGLAAAILGRFQSMTAAVAGGLAIGMVQSETTYLQAQHTWLPSSGLPELVPLALILIVLVARAKPLPSRGGIVQQTLGRAPRPGPTLGPTGVGAAVAVIALVGTHGAWRAAVTTSLIFGIISLSLVVVTGYAGQVSLAQLTLAGVAGFILSPMTVSWGIPFPIAPVLAALVAMVVGVVVGLPALRIRGLPVAVVTLALAVAVQALWFQNTDIVGPSGKNIHGPTFFGLNLEVGSGVAYPRIAFCLMVLVVVVLVGASVARLRTSRLGSAMLAVRANERSAAAAGIDVVRTKIAAFGIAAFIAGIGGSLLAYKQGNVTFDSFDVILGLTLFATVYLAGITSVSGGLLAGVLGTGGIVFLASDRWISLGGWYGVVTGVGFILTVVLNPEGIVGPLHERLSARRLRTLKPHSSASMPSQQPTTAAAQVEGIGATRPSEEEMQAGAGLLKLSDLRVTYGGMVAVKDVSIAVPEGAIVGLIGPNGAGKTTLVDAISGFVPSMGTVTLDGKRLDTMRPFERIRAGLGRTFQGIELWNDLSVRENVAVGSAASTGRSKAAGQDAVDGVLALLGLTDVADRPAGELSQGHRQLVSIARALVGGPRILLLDEPAGGLDSTESRWLSERLRDIVRTGVTILLIDHDMGLVLGLCDLIFVLDFGSVIATGSPEAVRADRRVADAYLGALHTDVGADSV
jgi:ABC-type branched-subunit amino acid transport system ATPase component/branched-subunit amino acid ABC-type transport system permease component